MTECNSTPRFRLCLVVDIVVVGALRRNIPEHDPLLALLGGNSSMGQALGAARRVRTGGNDGATMPCGAEIDNGANLVEIAAMLGYR